MAGQNDGAPTFSRVLGRLDLVLFSVAAILTIDSLASSASMGASWFSWWIVVLVLFFVPYALITAELGAAWRSEGGVYVWVREAFGPRWGSLAAWFYWINNAYWIPSVYMVFAATFHDIFLRGWIPAELDRGPRATWLEAGIAVVLTWLTVWLGVIRLSVSKWVPNLGALVKLAIFLSLGALGIAALFEGRPPANPLSLDSMRPRWGDSLAFLPVLIYNVLGLELMSSAGEEMKDPQRDVPRAILASGALIGVVYALGILGILLAVPLQKLSLVTGTWDALAVLGREWGAAGDAMVSLLGVGFLYACVASAVTWAIGANRVAAAAARDGSLPAPLARLHARHHTPHVAFLSMGALATVLLLGNASVAASASNVFWSLFKLSSLCFLFSYLMAFPSFLKLRLSRPGQRRPYRVPGGNVAGLTAAALCFVFIAGACVLFFRPSPDTDPARAMRETWLLVGECVATLVVGLWLMPRASGRSARPGL